MSATLTTQANLLKTVYAFQIQDATFKAGPVAGMLKRKKMSLTGEQAVFPVRTALSQGVGARSATSTLPTAGSTSYERPAFTPKSHFGRVQVFEDAMDRSSEATGSYAKAWDEELTSMREQFLQDFAMELLGDGRGALAYLPAADNQSTLTVASWQGPSGGHLCHKGAVVDLVDATDDTTLIVSARNVTAKTSTEVTIDGVAPAGTGANDYFIRSGSRTFQAEGIRSVVNTANPTFANYGGINRTTSDWWKAQAIDGTAISEDKLNQLADACIEYGAKLDLCVTTYPVQRMLFNLLQPLVRFETVNLGPKGLEISYEALKFRGIPIVGDPMVWKSELFMLDTASMHVGEPSPMHWLDKDGSPIHNVANYAAYEAVLIWQWQLVCRQPWKSGRMHSITAA